MFTFYVHLHDNVNKLCDIISNGFKNVNILIQMALKIVNFLWNHKNRSEAWNFFLRLQSKAVIFFFAKK